MWRSLLHSRSYFRYPTSRNVVGNLRWYGLLLSSKSTKPLQLREPLKMVHFGSKRLLSRSAEPQKTSWERFLGPKPMPERYTALWYREILLICTVFGITGSSTMMVRSLCFLTEGRLIIFRLCVLLSVKYLASKVLFAKAPGRTESAPLS